MAIWRDKLKEPRQAPTRRSAKLLDESPEDSEALDLVLDTNFPAPAQKDPSSARPDGARRNAGARADRSRAHGAADQGRQGARRLAVCVRRRSVRSQALVGADAMIEQELDDPRRARGAHSASRGRRRHRRHDRRSRRPRRAPAAFRRAGRSTFGSARPVARGARRRPRNRRSTRAPGFRSETKSRPGRGRSGSASSTCTSAAKSRRACKAWPAKCPSLVVGTGIRAPLTAEGRQAIVRELFALRRGISVIRTRDDTTVAAIVVAACNFAEVRIDSPPYAMLSDVQRQLGKALSRRTRRCFPTFAAPSSPKDRDTRAWARAALASMYRMAAIAAGDVSLVLADALGAPLAQGAGARSLTTNALAG